MKKRHQISSDDSTVDRFYQLCSRLIIKNIAKYEYKIQQQQLKHFRSQLLDNVMFATAIPAEVVGKMEEEKRGEKREKASEEQVRFLYFSSLHNSWLKAH